MEEKKGALGQTETAEAVEGAEQAAQKGFTRRQVVIGDLSPAALLPNGGLLKKASHRVASCSTPCLRR